MSSIKIDHTFFASISPLLLGLFLLLFPWSDRSHTTKSNQLDLAAVDTVRVLLYDTSPPNTIHIKPLESSLYFYINDQKIEVSPDDERLKIGIKNNQLTLEIGEQSYQTKSLKIVNDHGLTQLQSDRFGFRSYRGEFHINPHPLREALQIINYVPLEDYVASVVGSEMNFTEFEALKTQAVVSRTYALWSIQGSPYQHFDLKDYEASQVYLGAIPSKPWYLDAALSTHGEILTWSDKLILSSFSSTCGGMTSNNEDVWSGRALPYLRSVSDHEMCSISPHHRWEFDMKLDELNTILEDRYDFKAVDSSIDYDNLGRVNNITFVDRNKKDLTFSGNEFRLLINRNYTPLSIRSTHFSWQENGDEIQISGKGLGHGVGLCQWGAKGFAQNGWDYKDILSFYFSGTKVVDFHSIESQKIELHK
ncbi:MAG: SpoIID/LytB domain-containing protein [Balneolaceae bacterium]